MQLNKLSPLAAGLLLASLLSACGGGKGDDEAAPAAAASTGSSAATTGALTVTPAALSSATPAVAQAALQFDGGVCGGGKGTLSASWNFGDGSLASSSPTHTYTTAGTRTVTVTCSDTGGTFPAVSQLNLVVSAAPLPGFLGKTWSTYASIDTNNASIYPVAGLATSGDIYGVWLPSLGSGLDVAASTTNFSTSTWTVSEPLLTGTDTSPFDDTQPGGRTAAIDIAVSPNGHVMAAWVANSSIWFATKNGLNGTWSDPEMIAAAVLDASVKVVVNDAGNGAIGFCTPAAGAQVIVYTNTTPATRTVPVGISKQCDLKDVGFTIQRHRSFDIAIDNTSSIVSTVGVYDTAPPPTKSIVAMRSYTPGTGWGALTSISGILDTPPSSISYSRAPNGSYAAVAWDQVNTLTPFKHNVYASVYANASWGTVKAVQANNNKDYSRPLIAVNDSGDVFLAMQLDNETVNTKTYVSNYDPATSLWRTNPVLATNSNVSAPNDTRYNATDVAIDTWGTGLVTRTEVGTRSQAGTFAKNGTTFVFKTISPQYTWNTFHYQTMRALPDGSAILVTAVNDSSGINPQSGYMLLK